VSFAAITLCAASQRVFNVAVVVVLVVYFVIDSVRKLLDTPSYIPTYLSIYTHKHARARVHTHMRSHTEISTRKTL
jgi:uncharacterized protein HemY